MSPYKPNIKICGITNAIDAQYSVAAGAHYLGFIFYEKSPRYIKPETAKNIISKLDGVKTVGVFVNESAELVNKIADDCKLDFVQLHGNESPQYCGSIHKPVIKAIHVTPETSATQLQKLVDEYENNAAYYLFDSKVDGLWGGTGKTFNNMLLNQLQINKKYFIAGGINAENARRIADENKPFAIDISSSLELKPGTKDHQKIDDFFANLLP